MNEYLQYLAQTATWLIAIIILVAVVVAILAGAAAGNQDNKKEGIVLKKLNKKIEKYKKSFENTILDKKELKQLEKNRKKEKKANKNELPEAKHNVFVLNFNGDIKASQVEKLREEISAILLYAKKEDQVVIKLESPGGMVHGYGLAASQLKRITDKGIPLTVCVDKVAASGGYMMACIADKIVSAPFAVIGSIGVVAQVPNIHKLLKKHDIDVELHTAGKYKRTLTMIGENTEEGREKFREDLNETHELFKEFVHQNRRRLNIDEVANGDVWYGSQAIKHNLVDEISTSDEYLNNCCETHAVWEVTFKVKQSPMQKFGKSVEVGVEGAINKQLQHHIAKLWMK
ncbi:protease SohB [Marinicellulosiphila megalodicopiae]|uniref:protease SohB n=1 Tax=Marinicellulosiphila megalodicopiae TaxID=2724896 RepID=UPI003BAF5772